MIPSTIDEVRALTGTELRAVLGAIDDQVRRLTGIKSLVVGAIAERSAPELGLSGLARQSGFASPEELVRDITGEALIQAKKSVAVGRVVIEAADAVADRRADELRDPLAPWLHDAARLLSVGSLSVEQFQALRDGIGRPSTDISADLLRSALAELLTDAPGTPADSLRAAAALARDRIDEAGIRDREAARYSQRSFRITRQADGMSRATWMLHPEDAEIVHQVFDRITSPKLGGPRFVDSERAARADAIGADPRTPFQLASDVMVQLLRQGVDADPSQLLGSEPPAVQVVVTSESFSHRDGDGHGHGHGVILGTDLPVSIATVERLACAHGTQQAHFELEASGGQHGARPLDLGRTERLYSRRQKRMMAIRDGGCRWCGRPPSWTEAHHIKHWARDRGPTNIDDGVLLCRRCHLRVHNEGWEINHPPGEPAEFQLIPPAAVDPARTPIPLPTRSRIMGELRPRRDASPDRPD